MLLPVSLQVLALPCFDGKQVAINVPSTSTHRTGIIESGGTRIRCQQCVGAVEARRQQVVAGAASGGGKMTGGWDEAAALQAASYDYSGFLKHCSGSAAALWHPLDVIEVASVRISLRVSAPGFSWECVSAEVGGGGGAAGGHSVACNS